MSDARTRYRIRQGGMTVASAEREADIMHYAMVYRQDGEVTIQYYTGTHWKRWALMCQWPLPPAPDKDDAR